LAQAIRLAQLVEDQGWPDAKTNLRKKRIEKVNANPEVFVLKAKPGLWRLHLHAEQETHQIIYLYASRKNDKKLEANTKRAVRRLLDYREGKARLAAFNFPTD
jgi:hypothetical protein